MARTCSRLQVTSRELCVVRHASLLHVVGLVNTLFRIGKHNHQSTLHACRLHRNLL